MTVDEIEKLYTEAVPNKRGKMSMLLLDLTFRKIGISLTVKQIRNLFFQYDKTKSKVLDLDEFRLLIEDIIRDPLQSQSILRPAISDDTNQGTGPPGTYHTKSKSDDKNSNQANRVHGGLFPAGNLLKPSSLWSSDDVQFFRGNADLYQNIQKTMTAEEEMFAEKVKQLNMKYEVIREQRKIADEIHRHGLREHQRGKENLNQRRRKLTRTLSLPRKWNDKKKLKVMVNPSSFQSLASYHCNDLTTLFMDMYGENSSTQNDENALRRNTAEEDRSQFTRNLLRKSVDSYSNVSIISTGLDLSDRARIVGTYTLPRKSSRKFSKSSHSTLVQSTSPSRRSDSISRSHKTDDTIEDQNKTSMKKQDFKCEKETDWGNLRQQNWPEQHKYFTLPGRPSSKGGKFKYSNKSIESSKEVEKTNDKILSEPRVTSSSQK